MKFWQRHCRLLIRQSGNIELADAAAEVQEWRKWEEAQEWERDAGSSGW